MDRIFTYPGAIPLETDLAYAQVAAMVGVGYLAEAALGVGTSVYGLSCIPNIPADLRVQVGRGMVAQSAAIDATAFGSIPANAGLTMKMGINVGITQVTLAAPTTVGQSQCFLIQTSLQESDADPVAIPYYNAGNPAVSWSGPGNSGVPQNTHRVQRAIIGVVAGVASPTGSQTIPAVTAGWVPLHVVTLSYGQTSITSASIAQHSDTPQVQAGAGGIGIRSGRYLGTQRFIASGSYIPSVGTRFVRVTMSGGGAGGGGSLNCTGSQCSAGSGGGSGAYLVGILTAGFAGQAVTVGTGGGGTAGGNGGNGGATTFAGLTAAGGGGGLVGSPQPVGFITSAGAGGGTPTGSGLLIARDGGDGGPGLVINGSNNVTQSGHGGSCPVGEGGGNTVSGIGGAGRGYGAGGAGAGTQNSGLGMAGGAGAGGLVLIEEYT